MKGDQSLAGLLWLPDSFGDRMLRHLALALFGSCVLALSARVQVPMWPVPMTMQTLAVALLALTFGARLATGTVALYLAQGAAGLPVFASGGGFVYFLGPTGGYLVAFLVVAAAVGWLADRGWGRSRLTAALAMAVSGGLTYVVGAGWLALHVGAEKALMSGVLPFLTGDLLKAVLGVLILPALWRLVGRLHGRG